MTQNHEVTISMLKIDSAWVTDHKVCQKNFQLYNGANSRIQ